jgi:hypothetical protein
MTEQLGEMMEGGAMARERTGKEFVGLYFHTFNDNGSLCRQGQILKQLPNGKLICQVYSWLTALPNGEETYSISDTDTWNLYTSHSEWISMAEVIQRRQKNNAAA